MVAAKTLQLQSIFLIPHILTSAFAEKRSYHSIDRLKGLSSLSDFDMTGSSIRFNSNVTSKRSVIVDEFTTSSSQLYLCLISEVSL
jgi:hypothetical protein